MVCGNYDYLLGDNVPTMVYGEEGDGFACLKHDEEFTDLSSTYTFHVECMFCDGGGEASSFDWLAAGANVPVTADKKWSGLNAMDGLYEEGGTTM